MQRLLVIALCVAAAGAVAYAKIPSASALWAEISPWGVGVVFGSLLAAVIAGEVARLAKLPRVFAYAAVGLFAIPVHGGFLRPAAATTADPAEFFRQWSILFSAGIALTGLAVGLRFDLLSFRSHLRAIFLHTVGHVVLGGGAIFALVWWVSMRMPQAEFPVTLPAMVIIALLASTTGPAAIYAVNTDLRVDGKLPELQLLIAVSKNAILMLAVAVVATVFPDGVASVQQVPWEPIAIAIGSTLIGGIVAGLVLLGALRWASEQVVLVAATLCAISALMFTEQHLQIFGSAFFAGLIVAASSRFAFQLSEALDRASSFFLAVVFVFAVVNVAVPLSTTVWLFAVVAVPIRAVAMVLGSTIASRLSSGTGGRHLPYSLLAQALVALFALDWLQGSNTALASAASLTGPFVLLNLLVGTLLHRVALIRSGYAAAVEDPAPGADVIVHSGRTPVAGERTLLDDERSLLPEPQFRSPALRSDRLNRIVARLRQRLLREQDNVAQRFFTPRRAFVQHLVGEVQHRLEEHCRETVALLESSEDPRERRELMRDRRAALEAELLNIYVVYGPSHEPGALEASLHTFIEGIESACEIESQIRAPEEDVAHRVFPGDSRYQRFRKKLHDLNIRFGPRPLRVVPIRALALHHFAHGVAERMGAAIHLDGRFRIYVWQRITNAFEDVSEMYLRTLDKLDEDVAERDQLLHLVDEADARRETEELAEFDRRLQEGGELPSLAGESDGGVEPLLGLNEPSSSTDAVLVTWNVLITDLPMLFGDLERDALDFEADVRRRVALTVDAAYQAFLDDLAIAGTFALPARTFEASSRAAQAERAELRLDEEIAHWRRLALSFVDRRAMHLGFRDVEHRLRALLGDFVRRVETELCSHLTYYPAEISERCTEVVDSLSQTFDVQASDADLADAFVQIRHNLSDFLQDEALRSVQEMREDKLFAELVRTFLGELDEIVRDQRTVFYVADESYLDRPETSSALDIVPETVQFQDVLEKYLIQTSLASFNELAMRVGTIVDAVATSLGEVNRIIAFNLDAATGELRMEDSAQSNRDLVAEFAIGGIRRAGENASELLEQVQEEVDGIDDSILELTIAHVRTVRRYLFDPSMGKLERLALDVERDRSNLQRRGLAVLRTVGRRASDLGTSVARPAHVAKELALQRFSLQEHGREELVEDAAIATFEWNRIQELPLAYRRLFTPTPVEIPELFVARSAEQTAFEAAVRRWREQRKVSIVITGDFGSGKTSFLHRELTETLSDIKMLRWNVRERLLTEDALCHELSRLFGVRRVDTVPHLLAALADIRGQRVVIVDGIERLFRRSMHGSGALVSFLSLISQSSGEILWLVSANAALWKYLVVMASADDFFTDRIDLQRLSREQTEELILRRHRVSGYPLKFRADSAETLTPRRFSDGAQDRLRRRYFERLWEVTGGHPLSALYHWLSSLDVEHDQISVMPLKPLRVDHLRRLAPDKLIGLGQLLLHEELTEDGYAEVMRLDPLEARRDLAYFEAMNLIVREPGRKMYFCINEVLYSDLSAALTERNIILRSAWKGKRR